MKAEDFVGLSKKTSQDLSERYNLIYRLIRVDGQEYFPYPEDERTDRVCVEIENGQVVKATIQ